MKKLLAFTLMEIMIAMSLVGVIAILTVPNVTGKYNQKVYIARTQRFYNQMSDALAKYKGDNKTDNVSDIWGSQYGLKTFLNTYFDVAKDCGFGKLSEAQTNGCLASNYKYLDGTDMPLKNEVVTNKTYNLQKTEADLEWTSPTQRKGISSLCDCKYFPEINGCTSTYAGGVHNISTGEIKVTCNVSGTQTTTADLDNYCVVLNTGATVCLAKGGGGIIIDVNGKSSPNTKGRDLFAFMYSANGNISDHSIQCSKKSTNGCLGKLMENNWVMDY